MRLTTHTGRALDVEDEPDYDLGAVRYRIAKVGTITVYREEYGWPERDPALSIDIRYGAWHGGWRGRDPLPEQPRIFGVEIGGGACFRIASIDPERHWGWLSVRRPDIGYASQGRAPERTSARMAEYVAALVEHHLARPDLMRLDRAQEERLAPDRFASVMRDARHLQEEIADREQRLARLLALADQQQAIIQPEPEDEAVPA